MSPHDNGQQDDRDATNYAAPPAASTDTHGTRYSDAPADPHATAYTPSSGATDHTAAGRLPRRFGGYELLAELGHGGMGVVYKAREFTPERMVALKVIRSGELADAEDVRRFRQEADEAARLDHPHITPVYEVGEHDGLHFFTMKLVEGGSLSQHLERYQNDPKAAAKLTATAARAVHYAHQRQLLHRDLKPGNILLDAVGQPHVADFGLAKRMGGAGEASQSQGVGTPEYMAPEQARGDARLTTAADVYALGGVLYALLTGRPPFRGDSSWATIEKVLTEEPTPPSKIRPNVPRDLETICLKCLQKEPARRYGSSEALAEDLDRWLRGEPIRARSVGTMERVTKWAQRKPAAAAAYGLLLAALVLGAGGGGATTLWLNAENARDTAEKAEHGLETTNAELAKTQGDLKTALQGEQDAKRQLTQYSYADKIGLAQREWEAGNVLQARSLLQGARDLQEELNPKTTFWEWDYIHRVIHPELTVLERPDGVTSVAFSPNGSRIASGEGETVRLWDAAGKPVAVLQGHADLVLSVAFSPDGRRLASAGVDKTVRLWDADSGKSLSVLQGHTDFVLSVAFSPDGRRLVSAGQDNTVRLWDAATGKPLAVLKGHIDAVFSVAFSPDGHRLASGGNDTILGLWDTASGKPIGGLRGHHGPIRSLAFSPDGCRLASADNKEVRLWDATDAAFGRPLLVFQGHEGGVDSLAFSPDGARLATADVKKLRLWDVASGKPLVILQGRTDFFLMPYAFSPDGCRLVTSGEKAVRLWDVASGKSLAVLQGHEGGVFSAAFSPDGGRLATAGQDHTVRLWDAAGKPVAVLQGHTGKVLSVAFSPDGRVIASGGDDKTVRLWDAAGKPVAVLEGHEGGVDSLAFSPDGARLASASDDHTVRLWDAASGKPLVLLQGHEGGVFSIAFSPDGARLASAGEDKAVRLWDVASGKPLVLLQGHEGRVFSLAFSPDGRRLASASDDKTVRLWIARENAEEKDKRRRYWREQQAADAEKDGNYFAAAFHLNYVIDARPADATLYVRRCKAELRLSRWQPAAVDFLQALARWPADEKR